MVAYVAWEQQKADVRRLRHELYDRRLTVYRALMDFLAAVTRDGEVTNKQYIKWRNAAAGSYFLFASDMNEYLELIGPKALELRNAVRRLSARLHGQNTQQADAEVDALADRDQVLLDWFEAQYDEARERFAKYLRLAD